MMGKIRHDASYLISTALLILGVATAITGLVSDFLGLHDFFYHKYAGYTAAALALAHVCLHWNRLITYGRRRL